MSTATSPATAQQIRSRLAQGLVIPAHPLALDAQRKMSEKHQRALTRYYIAAGAGGLAVGVHTTQFAIRDAKIGLYKPVLQLAAEEAAKAPKKPLMVAGVCGKTEQAVSEAQLAVSLGYDFGLLSLAAMGNADNAALIAHCREVAKVIPIFGFYLQTAVGGRRLDFNFWREFASIDNVVGIKMAPFNRYHTIDVLRGVAESGRTGEVVLYTGNDDNIVIDLLTTWKFGKTDVKIVGGLLGQWAVGTKAAVDMLDKIKRWRTGPSIPHEALTLAQEVTDLNAAVFDVANNFHGCIAGIHHILVEQGIMPGRWCLDPKEDVSPGQIAELERTAKAYPHLIDDAFIKANKDAWLR
jgi:hypothetical protein